MRLRSGVSFLPVLYSKLGSVTFVVYMHLGWPVQITNLCDRTFQKFHHWKSVVLSPCELTESSLPAQLQVEHPVTATSVSFIPNNTWQPHDSWPWRQPGFFCMNCVAAACFPRAKAIRHIAISPKVSYPKDVTAALFSCARVATA